MSGRCALSRVARSPGKTIMLFGRSALITLGYIAVFADSVEAFDGGPASSGATRWAVARAGEIGCRPYGSWPCPGIIVPADVMKRHTKPFVANQLASVTAFALVGVLVVSCAPSVSTSLRRAASTSASGTRPSSAPGSFPVPAPTYLGVGFAPHACIGFPATAHASGDTVFIDPGHGGDDRGAQGVSHPGPGVDEATANLAVALDLLPLLRRAGSRVVLSRTTDTSVAAESSVLRSSDGIHLDNEARVACANAAHANVLVSIHMNGFGDRSAGGAETIYDAVRPFATANERLARLLQSDILASVLSAGWSIPDRGVLTDENQGNATPGAPAGWHHLFLLGPAFPGWDDHPSQMPGAVVEPLFVTNPLEDRIVASRAGNQAIAQGIARAVESFVAGVAPR